MHCDLIGAKVKQLVFVSEFDDSCGMMSEILDKNTTNSDSSEEHFDFGKRVAGTPFADGVTTITSQSLGNPDLWISNIIVPSHLSQTFW